MYRLQDFGFVVWGVNQLAVYGIILYKKKIYCH